MSIQCTAQTNIVNSTDCDSYFNESSGDYYRKDLNNVMDHFTGVWKWINGNKEFTLTLIKQVKHHFNQTGNDNYYEDRLVSYYKVKENGNVVSTPCN